jgi:hypothetical protein
MSDIGLRKPKDAGWSPPLAPTNADWAWWQRCAAEAGDRADDLTPNEREFIFAMAKWRGAPSRRQLEWLVAIFGRLFGKAPARPDIDKVSHADAG